MGIKKAPESIPSWVNYKEIDLSLSKTYSLESDNKDSNSLTKSNFRKGNSAYHVSTIFSPGTSEGTVFYSKTLKQWAFVCIFPDDDFISLGLSSSIIGPWNFTKVYTIPDTFKTESVMVYAAKYH